MSVDLENYEMARSQLQPIGSFLRREEKLSNPPSCIMLAIKHSDLHEEEDVRSSIMPFKDRGTEDIFDGEDSRRARKTLPSNLHDRAGRTLDQLSAAVSLDSLSLPGLHLEKLTGDRVGQHSIRINDQCRICFRWTERDAENVEIVGYHSDPMMVRKWQCVSPRTAGHASRRGLP